MHDRWVQEARDGGSRLLDSQLREEELEFGVVRRGQIRAGGLSEIPELSLERTQCLFSRLVEELVVRVGGLAPSFALTVSQP